MQKLYKINIKNIDVLIVDEVGSEWIRHCIPSCYSVGVLKIRGVVPYFRKMSFYLFLFKRIVKLGIKYKALISAIIDETKPRAIITFVDNNRLLGDLNEIFPNKLVISVQNGFRTDSEYDNVGQWDNDYKFPHYFGFGDYAHELMISKDVQIKKYYLAGSLKMGLFLSKYRKKADRPTEEINICFVSQQKYRPNSQLLHSSIIYQYEKMTKDIYLNLTLWSEKNKSKVTVAMVNSKDTEGYDHELTYYQDIIDSKNITFQENTKNDLTSYQVGVDSRVIVSVISTLGFELFGCGVRVLFCGIANSNLTKKFGLGNSFRKIPECVLLNDLTQESFNAKMDALLRMDNKEYLSLTQEARSYYVKCEKPYAHEQIFEIIDNFCKS